MTQNNSRFDVLPPSSQFNEVPGRLSRLQAALVSEALKRSVDDANAAMAHQLGEPLTALLLYLHEIKQVSERSEGAEAAPEWMRESVDMALRETQRVCEIIEAIRQTGDTPLDAAAAIARGHDAIDAWAADGSGSRAHPRTGPHRLTPREREVLVLIIGGSSNKEGGRRLGISTRTFEAHRAHLMGKLGVKNAADLMRMTLGAGK